MSARDPPHRLFLRVCDDVEQRILSNDDYAILKLSGLLRQLLLDASPLVHQVNRTFREDVEFEITRFAPPDSGGTFLRGRVLFWNVQDGLDPRTSPPGRGIRRVNLEEFLHTIVLRSNGIDHSIKDVILFEANVMGGVHAGVPHSQQDFELGKIGNMFSIEGLPAALRQLKAISRVTLAALRPLKERVLRNQTE